jgi:stearoyl-CoA desaturase (delta-9 desaturase)
MTNIFTVTASNFRNFHMIARLFLVAMMFVVEFSPWYLLVSFIAYLIYFAIGQGVMLHRYYSHNMFKFRFAAVKWIFVIITMMTCRGGPIGWSYVHRVHHENVDDEHDPHSPHHSKFNLFGLSDDNKVSGNMNPHKVKNLLSKENLRLAEYYWLYALTIPAIMLILSVEVFYYGWLVPICLFQFMSMIFNYANHVKMPGSYTNHSTGKVGKSVNNWLLWPLAFGEAWHNNHHARPGDMNFGYKWWEIDPNYWIIKLVKK